MNSAVTFNTAQEWLAWLEQQHPVTEIELGLGRIRKVAKVLLADRPIAEQVITVAGTNGKGSTIAYLGSILKAAGISYAALTSPHFVCFNERISFDGEMVSDADLCASFERVNAARIEADDEPVVLTYFEFNALLAFDLMQQRQPQVALLEIGLGGRLDAVNVVDPDIALVTSIAVDHVDWLGDDIEVIGREKAGIFRAGKPAIFGHIDGPQSVADYAKEIGAQWFQNGQTFSQQASTWQNQEGQKVSVPQVSLPPMNVAAVIQAIKLLPWPISEEAIATGLQNARLTGRYQRLQWQQRELILDVAHNPHAAANLAKQLASEDTKVIAVFAILSDKDYQAVVAELKHCIGHWHIAPTTGIRGLDNADLTQVLATEGVTEAQFSSYENTIKALHGAIEQAPKDAKILVFGSFHTVGDVLGYLQQHEQQPHGL